jgi:ATP-dependent DNA helicase RecG
MTFTEEHETIGACPMTLSELQAQVALSEASHRQFKQDLQSLAALAAEMAAFANSEGGVILLGVADDGSLPGLSLADVSRLNQMISNVAAQHVRSPLTVQTENVDLEKGVALLLRLLTPWYSNPSLCTVLESVFSPRKQSQRWSNRGHL